ncbi:hypothetical protein NQ318_018623 [Aromia moschata]|uniref:Uncharacterized protein n=1 Tax=Aromia moschata TaxID=1265417 RepID=A0AAV8ZFR5_9CUCU|nr:hypothetical protein NQ318_018623 [Aromia moschata]
MVLSLRYNSVYGRQVRYMPDSSRHLYDDLFGTYWPLATRRWYPYYWPLEIYDLWPTEHHLRKIRIENKI